MTLLLAGMALAKLIICLQRQHFLNIVSGAPKRRVLRNSVLRSSSALSAFMAGVLAIEFAAREFGCDGALSNGLSLSVRVFIEPFSNSSFNTSDAQNPFRAFKHRSLFGVNCMKFISALDVAIGTSVVE